MEITSTSSKFKNERFYCKSLRHYDDPLHKQKEQVVRLFFFEFIAWRRPTLAGAKPQLPSALKSLTTVFGMGTGVTSSQSLPDNELISKDKNYYMHFL